MKTAVLKTLAYADIFDYPLTKPEIYHWSVGPSSSVFSITHPLIQSFKNYYFLTGRRNIVSLRQSRARSSRLKLRLATKVGEWLKFIPTIKLVAVTGALAMRNSDPTDDIDLMIVTSPHTLWLTRPLVVLLLELLGRRRRPAADKFNNQICLNLWLDTTALAVPSPQHNLYTAHEVAQVKPLWSRGNAYHQFLSANRWINQYLPHINIPQVTKLITHHWLLLTFLNRLAFRFQLWYMRHHLTRERVSLHAAFFHPRDTGKLVMRQYHHRLTHLSLKP